MGRAAFMRINDKRMPQMLKRRLGHEEENDTDYTLFVDTGYILLVDSVGSQTTCKLPNYELHF